VAYVWVFALGTHDARATPVAALVTVWGARLTFNFARRGGYAPAGEDYRWGFIRSRVQGWAFAVIAAGTPLLWTAAGAVLLTLLFLGSTAFTEWISKSRHPEFEDYQHTTSMLVPWRPRRDAR